MILKNVHILDVVNEKMIRNIDLSFEDGRIDDIGIFSGQEENYTYEDCYIISD